MSDTLKILLASSSTTRKMQLQKLGLEFTCQSPNIDETQHENENVSDLVIRLSMEKALAIEQNQQIIIAGDQVMQVGNRTMGKPLNHKKAFEQLSFCSNKWAIFYTGLCLIDLNGKIHTSLTTTEVKFKKLSSDAINNYIESDNPVNCAGSIQIESKGLLLLDVIRSNDPFAVLGIPLTELNKLFYQAGFDLLQLCNQ